ncbi:MAG: ankyrin repeat domain-containing protein [Candidatus Solibacter sp.]
MPSKIVFGLLAGSALVAQVPAKVDFGREVLPILREHCVECHGPAQQMRGFRLDRRRDALPNRVGANGARIVPGKSESSLLYRRVSAGQMPPGGALGKEQIATVKKWIDEGADWPDALSGERSSAAANPTVAKMMLALRNGAPKEFERVLSERPEAANAKGERGWTPLMYAAVYGDVDAVQLLLGKQANPNAQNDDGGTALMYSADDEGKTRALLEGGADPNLRSGEGKTALLIAAGQSGAYPVVKLLLEKGADARIGFPDGRGILSVTVGSRDPRVVQMLLDHGGGKKGIPLGPLLVAGCTACFDMLLPVAEPADVANGLSGAVRAGDVARLKALLERGAQPAAPLLRMVAVSHAEIPPETLADLIARGADVRARNPTGLSLLELTRRQGKSALAEAFTRAGAAEEPATAPELQRQAASSPKIAVERILPALQRADVAFLERGGCVSCHNNSLTSMSVAAARSKGVKVNEQIARDQPRKIAAFLQENAERALEHDGLPGAVDTVSYILLGLAADGYASDPITDVWARYVKNSQAADGRWVCIALRPPLESSDFEVTAASIRALKAYHPKSRAADYDRSAERGVRWLEKAQPITTEDFVFKALGLSWGGASQSAIRETAQGLLALQRADGGWGQTKALASDAYATGQALVALKAAGIGNARGAAFLMKSQLADGSWHVQTRASPLQPYFDSEFPHGADQFISAAASNWAAMALAGTIK